MSIHVHYHSDCDTFAGCEQMLVVLIEAGMNSDSVDVTFTYRRSAAYTSQAKSRLPTNAPMKGLALPDTSALRTAASRVFRGWVLHALKALTYAVPLRQAFQVFDVGHLWLVFRRIQPDIVHINNGGFPGGGSCNAAAVAARLARVPVVVYVVNNVATGYESPLRWVDYPLDRLTARSVTRFVTGSQLAATALRDVLRLPPDLVQSLHNGISVRSPDETPEKTRATLGIDAEITVVAVVARLESRKGHRHLIDAFGELVHRTPSGTVILVIEGTGPEEDALRNMIVEKQLGDRVRLVGQVRNVWNLLVAADIIVLPSVGQEDFPNVVLEAMAMGKPVIASSIAGIPEQIVDGETGLLVPPGDSAALSVALEKLLTDPMERVRMGEAGRERFNAIFTAAAATERFWSMYAELTERLVQEGVQETSEGL